MIVPALLFGLLAAPPPADERDVVVLTNGKELRGRVLVERGEKILFLKKGQEEWISLSKIRSLDAVARRMAQYLEEEAQLPAGAAPRVELAQKLRERGLEAQARLEATLALKDDPENAEARALLGHRKSQSRWLVPNGSGWADWEGLRKAARDWDDAWEFETEHFSFRTNHDPFFAFELGRDLERFYAAAFSFFAPAGPREVLERVSVHLHREPRDYPKVGLSRSGYFSPQENRLYLLLPEPTPATVVFHEAAHAISFHAIARRKPGALPAWLDEGLAEYLAGCVSGTVGRQVFRDGGRIDQHFHRLRAARDLASAPSLLNFSAADFLSSQGDMRYAQSYSFVHFLLHGNGLRYRTGFFAFLEGLHEGKSSPTRFLELLGTDAEEIGEQWRGYLKR